MSDTTANPAPREEVARASWADALTLFDNERSRRARWRDDLRAAMAAEGLSDVDRDTYRRGILDHSRAIAVYDVVSRMVERVKTDGQLLRRMREIDAEERGESWDVPEGFGE